LDVKFVQLEITDIKSVEAAVATVQKAEGRLDVLVNNAGMRFFIVSKRYP
jgi:NAD(P)-dependent dehydrogenase (short-subunit alcohol dehydrogenase family)